MDDNSSHSSDTRSETSDLEDIDLDLGKLQPYDFEPETSAESDGDSGSDSVEDDIVINHENMARIGNTNWCRCNRCRSMTTYEESLCCKGDVPRDYFGESACITEHEDFQNVCLNLAVLKTTLNMLNNLRGDNIVYENDSLRYAAYRQFTWWVHNRLGKGVRRVIPSCAIWAIREKYPNEDNNYIPFLEAREEENRLN